MTKNVIWQLLSSSSSLILGLLQVSILSRIIEINEFGYIAIAWVVINIFQAISDSGLSSYLVYKQKVDRITNATIFWLTLMFATSVAIFVYSISGIIKDFYGYEELELLIKASAIQFIIIGLHSQLQARYLLDFRHITLAKIDIVSKALGVVASVWLGFLYKSAWVMIAGLIITGITKTVMLWILSEKAWRPTLNFSVNEAKIGIKYGIYQIGGQILNQIRGNLDTVLLGVYLKPAELGIYSLAKNLIIKPGQVILPVTQKIMLPILAKERDKKEEFEHSVKHAHWLLCIVFAIIYLNLILQSELVTTIFYGNEISIQMTGIFAPLCAFWLVRTLGGSLVGATCQATANTKKEFNWNLFTFFVNTGITYYAVQHGSLYLVWSLLVMQMTLLPLIYWYFYRRLLGLTVMGFFMPIIISLLVVYPILKLTIYILSAFSNNIYFLFFTPYLFFFILSAKVLIRYNELLRKQ